MRILSPISVDLMTTDHIGDIPTGSVVQPGSGGFGLGFAIRGRPGADGEIGSEGAYYWSGFFNTTFWVDPTEEPIGILMTQIFTSTSDIQEKFRIMAYQASWNASEWKPFQPIARYGRNVSAELSLLPLVHPPPWK